MIVISEFMDETVAQNLTSQYPATYNPDLVNRPQELKVLLGSAQALVVRNKTQVDADLLDHGPNLRCVGRLGVGLDNIDLKACSQRNIKVFPATGANNVSVAEYVIGTAMVLLRKTGHAHASMIRGEWNRTQNIGTEIKGKTLGLIGLGAIGQLTAGYALGLGMNVQSHDPYLPEDHDIWQTVKPVSMTELAQSSDVISIHVPLVPETAYLVDHEFLSSCKKGAIIINTSRGGIMDERSLIQLLDSGHLGGAGIDVFEEEPLSSSMRQLYSGLNNMILTPHVAGVTQESNYRISQQIVDRVLDCLGVQSTGPG